MISKEETLNWVNENILGPKDCYDQVKPYLSEESIIIMENKEQELSNLNLSYYQHCIDTTPSAIDFESFAERINCCVIDGLIEHSVQTLPSILNLPDGKAILFFFPYSRHSTEYLKKR